jgi:hypothetical protein
MNFQQPTDRRTAMSITAKEGYELCPITIRTIRTIYGCLAESAGALNQLGDPFSFEDLLFAANTMAEGLYDLSLALTHDEHNLDPTDLEQLGQMSKVFNESWGMINDRWADESFKRRTGEA